MQVKRGLGPIPCNSTSPQTGANPRALTGHRGNTLRLLDRSKELHILNEAFTESTRSSGRFVIVTGGPGSGKTQLLHEFLAAPGRSGARILQGTAHPAERDRPMSLLRQLLRNGEVLPVQADPARPAGRQTEPLPRNAERRADMEFGDPDTATTETLLRLADGERPLVVAVDDAHLMDEASLGAVVHLLGRSRFRPVLVVCTTSGHPGTGHSASTPN